MQGLGQSPKPGMVTDHHPQPIKTEYQVLRVPSPRYWFHPRDFRPQLPQFQSSLFFFPLHEVQLVDEETLQELEIELAEIGDVDGRGG